MTVKKSTNLENVTQIKNLNQQINQLENKIVELESILAKNYSKKELLEEEIEILRIKVRTQYRNTAKVLRKSKNFSKNILKKEDEDHARKNPQNNNQSEKIKKSVHSWNEKAGGFEELERYDDAIQCYDKALKISPTDSYTWNLKGVLLSEYFEKNEEAIKCYDIALKHNPEYEYAWCNKGLSLYDLGKYDDAVKCYDKALKITPDDADAWRGKGTALKALGKHNEANKAYKMSESLGYVFSIDNDY